MTFKNIISHEDEMQEEVQKCGSFCINIYNKFMKRTISGCDPMKSRDVKMCRTPNYNCQFYVFRLDDVRESKIIPAKKP